MSATLARPRRRVRRPSLLPFPAVPAAKAASFAALAAFAAGHWAALVTDPPLGRVALVTLVGVVLAAGLMASARLPRPLGLPVRIGAVLVGSGLSLTAIGLPARLLKPGRWDELGENVDRGMAGLATLDWPYSGPDEWVRLTILLLAPLVVALSAAIAFWPGRLEGVRRALALTLLLALYGVAVAEYDYGAELFRGLVLFCLIGAWLWLPRLQAAQLAGAAVVVAGVGIAALPVAAALDRQEAVIDYRSWNPFGGERGTTFAWDHQYGPLSWSRDGTTIAFVKSRERYYWKVAALDLFDGLYWRRDPQAGTNPFAQIPDDPERGWFHEFDVTVRRLRSDYVVGAGTVVGVDGLGAYTLLEDGTARVAAGPLEEGDTYSFAAYLPDPSRRQLRAASEDYDNYMRRYTRITLPAEGEDATGNRPVPGFRRTEGEDVQLPPPPGLRGSLEHYYEQAALENLSIRRAERAVLASPYADMYRRSVSLVRGSRTTYDAVQRIYRYLHDDPRFRYVERVPTHPFPLAAFVGDDPRGYCQQFSGAMALMLRFVGIPARVAAGFSPGSYNRDTREFRVRDLDAHSWVEVYFPGIGWVPFDPTPPLAPAGSQADSAAPSGSRGSAEDVSAAESASGDNPAAGRPDVGSGSGDGRIGLWALPVGIAAIALLGAVALLARSFVVARRARRTEDAELHELRSALDRMGWRLPPGATLQTLESRLERVHGPTAAAYPRKLRRRRFAPAGGSRPTRADRRALRRALTAGGGMIRRLKGLWALPPAWH